MSDPFREAAGLFQLQSKGDCQAYRDTRSGAALPGAGPVSQVPGRRQRQLAGTPWRALHLRVPVELHDALLERALRERKSLAMLAEELLRAALRSPELSQASRRPRPRGGDDAGQSP